MVKPRTWFLCFAGNPGENMFYYDCKGNLILAARTTKRIRLVILYGGSTSSGAELTHRNLHNDRWTCVLERGNFFRVWFSIHTSIWIISHSRYIGQKNLLGLSLPIQARYCFVRERVIGEKDLIRERVNTIENVADSLMKTLIGIKFHYLIVKMRVVDIDSLEYKETKV